MTADEEPRAIEYRRQMLARDTNDRHAAQALTGSTTARRALLDAWEPIINRNEPPDHHAVR